MDFAVSHGGGQQVMLDLVRATRRAGRIAVPWVARNGWLRQKVESEKTGLFVVSPFRNKSQLPWRVVRFFTYFWTLFCNRAQLKQADAVIINDPELFMPASLVATIIGANINLYVHMAYRGLAARVVRWSAALRSVERLICVSQFVKRHSTSIIRSADLSKLVVVKNALSSADEFRSDPEPPRHMTRIAVVGRLVPEKGQDIVIDLAHRFPASQFFIVGPLDNADSRFLRVLRERSPGNVKFEGYQAPVIRYLQQKGIGIVLVPSRIAEACPLIPIEAVRAGCAVIARDIGGLAEVSADVGLVTVSSDDEFAEQIALLQTMSMDERNEMLSRSLDAVFSKFSPQRFEGDIAALFGWQVE